MSLLPSYVMEGVETDTSVIQSLEIPREYGINFETGELTGMIVEGLEAIKVWIWLALHIERYRYPIYSWSFGAEIEQYIGQGFSEDYLSVAVEDDVTECLLMNPWITGITDFEISLDGDKLSMSFTVNTDLGRIDFNV